MTRVAMTLAKLAGIHKIIRSHLEDPRARYFDPASVIEHFEAYNRAAAILRTELPDLFADLPDRPVPQPSGTTDHDGRGYIGRQYLKRVVRDINYIFEVRSHSELQAPVPQR